MGATDFIVAERSAQSLVFTRDHPHAAGHGGSAYRLTPEHALLNLAPSIREAARDYFARHGITWHRHANHGLSSQVCCLNFLMPLATRPDLLSKVIGRALGIAPPQMLPVEIGAFDQPWFVGFEWIGEVDYLHEAPAAGRRTRGANATSADAIVRFRHEGRVEALLIEWKYTETYGAPIPPAGNDTRVVRYKDLAFAPHGPIRADLGPGLTDFFWEPFYQMLRQQMLATGMQRAAELEAEAVRVLHISPMGNRALHKVTAPALRRFGDDAFEAFGAVLTDPSAFVGRGIEQVFGSRIAATPDDPWSAYLTDRYAFLAPATAAAQVREF
jgi:hypothetical protein